MTALLRAELLKLRTTRTFVTLVGVAVGLSLLLVVLGAALANDLTEKDVRELFMFDFSGLFILLLGVIGMAGEFRHRTITTSILAAPDRTRLLGARA
jgi:ABC-type transport system involved in multi-copper enzyme maturation permease subunit